MLKFSFLSLLLIVICIRAEWASAFNEPGRNTGLIEEDYVSIDKYAILTPKEETKSIERLSKYLVKPYYQDHSKVRSIFVWIVNNIHYDYQLAKRTNRKTISPQNVLKFRKGVCSGYADLFVAMCEAADIRAQVVVGYSRFYNFGHKKPFTWSDHAWNAVKLDGHWFLLDATWESKGYQEGERQIGSNYFLTDPKEFVIDHLPEDPIWQLLPCPITLADFKQSPNEITQMISKTDTCFSFADSINLMVGLLPPNRQLKSAQQAYLFNPNNHSTIGIALFNYGNYITSSIPKKIPAVYIAGKQREALLNYQNSLSHLRKAKRKDDVRKCKAIIRTTKKKSEIF